MSAQDYVTSVLKAFASAFQPLTDSLKSPQAFVRLLSNFGWTFASDDLDAITQAFGGISSALTALTSDAQSGQTPSVDQLGTDIQAAISGIRGLGTNQPSLTLFWKTFPIELLDFLVYRYLQAHAPLVFGLLRFLGVLSEDAVPADTATGRGAYTKCTVDWSRIPASVEQPTSVMTAVYDWGTTTQGTSFQYARFLSNLEKLLQGFRAGVGLYPAPDDLLDYYFDRTAPARPMIQYMSASPFMLSAGGDSALASIKIALIAMPVPPTGSRTADPDGFAVFPVVTGQITETIHLAHGVDIAVEGDFASKTVAAEIHPSGLTISVSTKDTTVSAGATLTATPSSPWVPIGTADASHIEIGAASAGLSAHGNIADLKQLEFKIEVAAKKAQLVLNFGEGDGFLQTILGGQPQTIDLSTTVHWSNRTGFGFSGQSQLQATLPVHQTIAGIVTVETIHIAIGPGDKPNSAALTVDLVGSLTLGPLEASVDRLGVQASLQTKSDGSGNLGDIDLGFGFKPPTGVGLLVDAAVVTGGGYLSHDEAKKEYTGVLELALEVVQLKAIGLLDTVMPDGSKGYSLLLILTAEFDPGFELGFGFTLIGVGGLVGINRTMAVDALRAGVKSHTLDSMLFPPDPVADAPQILSNLSAFFPVASGRFTFGPMLEIGWGEPTMITGELGVLLELPEPIRVAIVGIVTAALPEIDPDTAHDPDLTPVLIHIDVLGVLDTEKKTLSIDASIYDSHITKFALVGDMALRMGWGDNPNFALSLGGFNAAYQPPPRFPTLQRLMISLGSGDSPRMSLSAYTAVTSNTVQFGADLEVYASSSGFTVHGYLAFDALFILSPFSFQVELQGGVDVLSGSAVLMSISIDLVLSGPRPWHVVGTGKIHVLFFDVQVHVDKTFGDPSQQQLPQTNVLPLLKDALGKTGNWSATLPAGAESGVTLAPVPSDPTQIIMHPMGQITIRQKVVPLGTQISLFGSVAPADADYFDIATVQFAGTKESATPVSDEFAPGQFFALSDGEKLSRPAFELHPAGVTVGSADVQCGSNATVTVQYETFVVDDPAVPATAASLRYTIPLDVQHALMSQSAGASSLARQTGSAKFIVPGARSPISTTNEAYVVAGADDLKTRADISDKGGTAYSTAQSRLQSYLAQHPEETGKLHVVPTHEAVTP